jgi:hypothetical protein
MGHGLSPDRDSAVEGQGPAWATVYDFESLSHAARSHRVAKIVPALSPPSAILPGVFESVGAGKGQMVDS